MELTVGQQRRRCQRCAIALDEHGETCITVTRSAYDMSHSSLMDIEEASGRLLAAIMEFKSVESIQNSAFAHEFFILMDLRRKSE